MRTVRLLVLLILNFTVGTCFSQNNQNKKSEIFFGIGPTAYKGDLNASYSKWSMAFTLGLKFNRLRKVNGNVMLTIGSVTGQNVNYSFDDGNLPSPSPNSFFTTNITSLHYEVHYNFVNKENLKVYASQGIGILRFDPKDEFNESYIDQLSTRATSETYGNIALILPTQIGVLYKLPNDFSVGIQLGFTNTLTDYLDNISQWSPQGGPDNIFSYRFLMHVPIGL